MPILTPTSVLDTTLDIIKKLKLKSKTPLIHPLSRPPPSYLPSHPYYSLPPLYTLTLTYYTLLLYITYSPL
jgi:hypothetical protein